jgi:hypothetical protein
MYELGHPTITTVCGKELGYKEASESMHGWHFALLKT